EVRAADLAGHEVDVVRAELRARDVDAHGRRRRLERRLRLELYAQGRLPLGGGGKRRARARRQEFESQGPSKSCISHTRLSASGRDLLRARPKKNKTREPMTPDDIKALRKELRCTPQELGDALGLDAK